MTTPLDRLSYTVGTTARVGWYFGQYMLAARLSRGSFPAPKVKARTPDRQELLAELYALFRRDWSNIERGLYRRPHDLFRRPEQAIAEARAYFADLPSVNRRRADRGAAEVFRAPPEGSERLPRYYRQNFHYQTGGYLTEESARLYDHQVEVLFGGGADAMRRQALVPIREALSRRPGGTAGARLLDVACGTGQFMAFLRDNHPRLDITGIDLSVPYLREAARRVAGVSRPAGRRRAGVIRVAQANAEAIPLPDASVDLVSCVFLFHELPRKVRAVVAGEMARVLAPGGRLVFVDSLQRGDRPRFDGVLDYFPQGFHEPYYADYIRDDLGAVFAAHGLVPVARDVAFLSKVLVFDKDG
ncbi:MAG: class I SAM-dependent methyltransferase [Azospirillaceae bacterium]